MNECSWLFLRGLTRGAGHWGDFPAILQQELSLSDVFFVDLPGNGEEFKARSPWSIQHYTSFVRERALAKKKFPKLNVVAISMGGMITVDWMRHFPDEIHQAFLINTSAANFSPPHQRFQTNNFAKNFLQNIFYKNIELPAEDLTAAEKRELRILNLSSNNRQRSREKFSQLASYSKEHPVRGFNALRQISAAAAYSFPLKAPGSVVLLASERDRLVSAECSKRIAEAWKVPLELNLSAGHDLPLDDPHWLSQKIQAHC